MSAHWSLAIMRRVFRRRAGQPWRRALMASVVLAAGLGWSLSVLASQLKPHIDRIEPFLTDQVTIHFDTAANYTYQLQFLHLQTGNWSNLFVAPKVPFPNHYIIVDYRTNGMRMYRLRVTP